MDVSRAGGAIFAEKVRCPDPRGIWRARLERRLIGPDAPSTGLVLGPPGSGKTTLLALLAQRSRPVGCWYRAGSDDTEEADLVAYLATALAVDTAALPGDPPRTVDDLVRRLEEELPTELLVVDDLHVLAGTPAERALERFVLLRPRALRVVLGSRRPPQLNTPRMLAAGELCQLDGDDLRFRSWEVEEVFRVLHGRPLGPEAAAALTRRTGGWAAGLHLFHLATAEMSRHERDRAVAELTGRSRLIRSYLTRNVLDGLDPQRRRFLVRTSALGVLTSELCDELLDSSGSAEVLDELERHQFFTTSTDGVTFRYHQVLQTHLEVLLVDELGRQNARTLYARAADLLESAGRLGAAVRAYARAEDWGSVGRLAQQTHAVLPTDDDCAGLPSAGARGGTDDPGLAVVAARRVLRQGRIEDAVAAFTHAESLMDDPEFRDRCAQERAVAGLWLPAAPSRSGPPGEAVRLGWGEVSSEAGLLVELRALTRDVADPYARTHPLAVVLGLLLAGRTDEAAARVPSVLALDETGVAAWVPLVARFAAVVADQVNEPDESGAAALEQVVLGADLEGLPWLSRLARGVQAALLASIRPTPWRLAACQDLLADAERRRDRWAELLLSLLVGHACVRVGEEPTATAVLLRARDLAGRLDAPVLAAWARSPRSGTRTAPVAPAAAPVAVDATGAGRDIRLRCLGAFEVLVGEVEVDWRHLRPRARQLLQLLALHHGRPVHRERLIDAVWPEASVVSGTRSLQVAASSIRQCLLAGGLPEGCLHRHGDAYALELPGVTSDVARFEELRAEVERCRRRQDDEAAAAGRGAALAVYAGELLPELGSVDWVVEDRERLRTQAAQLAADAAEAALAGGDPPAAVALARRSVDIDPYRDGPWLTLTAALERLGDRAGAEVARRDHRRTLAALGLAPVTEPVLVTGPARVTESAPIGGPPSVRASSALTTTRR